MGLQGESVLSRIELTVDMKSKNNKAKPQTLSRNEFLNNFYLEIASKFKASMVGWYKIIAIMTMCHKISRIRFHLYKNSKIGCN